MKKLIFIGIIFVIFSLFSPGLSTGTVPLPEIKYIVNEKLKQCAVAKFDLNLSSDWQERDMGSAYIGCSRIIDSFLKKDLSFIRDVCNNGYLHIWYSANNWHDLETNFKELIDFSKTETFLISRYNRDIPIAVNANTGECSFAVNNKIRDQNIIPKISFKIKKEAEEKIEKYFYDKEYQQKVYKSFCEEMGYNFIGTLKYYTYTKTIIWGALLVGVIVIAGLIVFFRKKIH